MEPSGGPATAICAGRQDTNARTGDMDARVDRPVGRMEAPDTRPRGVGSGTAGSVDTSRPAASFFPGPPPGDG